MSYIEVNNLIKKFSQKKNLAHNHVRSIVSKFKMKKVKDINTLNNISFKINKGENVGIIGGNGAGKSTLLKTVAGIYQPNSGFVNVGGSIVYMSGFNIGLLEELTMRENIFFLGLIRGSSRKRIKEKINDILKFSELEDYMDTEIKDFSTGMISRVAFSIGLFCLTDETPDIILMDEIGLDSSGFDIGFKKKVEEKIHSLMKTDTTIIFASHSLKQVEDFCDKVIWIENGAVIMNGKPKEVIEAYKKSQKK